MKLFFKKLFTAPLYAGVMFMGVFGFFLVLGPFNLPYLLKLPQDSLYIFSGVFSLLFTALAAVIVRTGYCRREGVLEPDEKPLFLRVITFREYIMELGVFALLSLIFTVWVGTQTQTPLWWLVLGAFLLTAGETFLFAVANCLLWMISAKRAHK